MVGNVLQEKSFFSVLLIRTSVVLQWIGVLLLAGGAIVTVNALIQKADSVNWIVLLLGGAALSANLGMVCLILGYHKRTCGDMSINSLPACAESRDTPPVSTADGMSQREVSAIAFSHLRNQLPTQVNIIR